MTISNNWLCSLPWTGFSNDPDGKVRPCCIYNEHITDDNGQPYYVQTSDVKEIFNSRYMKNLRQQFRDGVKPAGCATCILDENNKVSSKRQAYNKTKIGSDNDYSVEPELPVEYQMILSNACNLKCRSCTPSHSNLWQAEHKILFGHTGYSMPHNQSGHHDSTLWNTRHEWMKYVQRLEIVGGEPFYIRQWQDLWHELVAQGYSNNIAIDMSTNCTIYGGDVIKDLIPKFRRIGIGLSIDGLGPIYEYLRHPGKWTEVEENIKRYYKLSQEFDNLGFSYTHTIGWLNAYQLPDFHQWTYDNTPNFGLWDNLIHWPKHLSLIMIPKSAKDKIAEKWQSYDWREYKNNIDGIVNFMYSVQPTDEEIAKEYKKFIIHDQYRNENILDIIPKEILEDVQRFFNAR